MPENSRNPICHWISTLSFTVLVKTDGVEIVFAAPLVARFLRQPVGNLLNWAKQFGGLRHVTWHGDERRFS